MADQIVITEKSSQAKDVRVAVGSRYGEILAAEGHLFDLLEPGHVVPAWKRWSPILLRPEGLYGTRPAEGGNKAAKLRAIREALRTAKRVWLATDCDREGQLIGQEILEHYEYRGQVMRVSLWPMRQTPSGLAKPLTNVGSADGAWFRPLSRYWKRSSGLH
jgi:DNA topoisomerase-3